MIKPPFDDLTAVTRLIELYTKDKHGMDTLARYFNCQKWRIQKTLQLHGVKTFRRSNGKRKNWEFEKQRWQPKIVAPLKREQPSQEKEIPFEIKLEGKYDKLIFEPINEGKDYKDYLKEKKHPD